MLSSPTSLTEHQPSKLGVAGSSPAAVTNLRNDEAPPDMATGEGLSAVVGVGLAARETTQRDPITLSEAFKEAFTLCAPSLRALTSRSRGRPSRKPPLWNASAFC